MKSIASVIAMAGDESLPVRGAWIEIEPYRKQDTRPGSLPVRGAWIEMKSLRIVLQMGLVAPRKGSVD